MNTDFHYYATHLAARFAGFTKEEANIIGYAAAFVDEVATSTKPTDSPDRVSFMTITELLKMSLTTSWSRENYRKFFEVWQCFHFLPGNEFYSKTYEGKRKNIFVNENSSEETDWTYTDEDEELFKSLCLPKSVMVLNMIENLKKHSNSYNSLHMLGISMHVLADTWSHQNFLGFPRWFSNEVNGGFVQVKVGQEWRNVKFKEWTSPIYNDDLKNLIFLRSPSSLYYEGTSYLGHGRIGSIPDYGCLEYRYKPSWSSNLYTRSNIDVFSNAFHQMVYALKWVKSGNGDFDPEKITDDYAEYIKPVLKTLTLDQSQEWNNLINNKFGYKLDNFDESKWFKEYTEYSGGNYVKFIKAADSHVEFVTRNLYTTRFKHETTKYEDVNNISSRIHYLNWKWEECVAVCMDKQLYMRKAPESCPTGNLKKIDYLEYLCDDSTTTAMWRCTINQSTGMFDHYMGTSASKSHSDIILAYLCWDGTPWIAKIIPSKYLL